MTNTDDDYRGSWASDIAAGLCTVAFIAGLYIGFCVALPLIAPYGIGDLFTGITAHHAHQP